MKIEIKVHTNSKNPRLVKNPDSSFDIYISVIPEKGKANKEVERVLSKHFKVPVSRVKIVQGGKTRHKLVEILV